VYEYLSLPLALQGAPMATVVPLAEIETDIRSNRQQASPSILAPICFQESGASVSASVGASGGDSEGAREGASDGDTEGASDGSNEGCEAIDPTHEKR